MMKHIRVLAIALGLSIAFVLTAGGVAARAEEAVPTYFVDGNKLLSYCQSPQREFEGLCIGYLWGVVDAMQIVRTLVHAPPCPGQGVIIKQIEDVVVRALVADPVGRSMPAAVFSWNVITNAWGCKPASGR
jgi:Rap1a immunity proteins